jgi:hypothetical protein
LGSFLSFCKEASLADIGCVVVAWEMMKVHAMTVDLRVTQAAL